MPQTHTSSKPAQIGTEKIESEKNDRSDLLAELAGEATQKLQALRTDELNRQAKSQSLHGALVKIFQFLNPFSTHLNEIKPVISHPYNVDPRAIYNNLQWSDAAADYRKQSLSDVAFFDHVSFRVRLSAPGPVLVKRRWNEVERLKKELHDFGLRTTDD